MHAHGNTNAPEGEKEGVDAISKTYNGCCSDPGGSTFICSRRTKQL